MRAPLPPWHCRWMARFHFDLSRDGEPWSLDEEGLELPSRDEAQREAVALAFALAGDRPPRRELSVRVRGGDARPLATVRLAAEIETAAADRHLRAAAG
jgi:hypothetical protein